jgi:hypothetical protein
MPRFILLRRSRAVVEHFLTNPALRGAARFAADAALLAHRAASALARAARTCDLRARPIERAGNDLDRLLAPVHQGVETLRSAPILNWLLSCNFESDPRNRKGLFGIYDRAGKLAAYFLAKTKFYETATHRGFKNLQLGSLLDWRIFDPAALSLQQLVLLAVREISAWNPDAIELCVPKTCGPLHTRRWGFVPAGTMHFMIKRSPKCPTRRPDLPEPPAWNLRPGDADTLFA